MSNLPIKIKRILLDGEVRRDFDDELLEAIMEDDELSKFTLDGRFYIDNENRGVWTRLKIRGSGS